MGHCRGNSAAEMRQKERLLNCHFCTFGAERQQFSQKYNFEMPIDLITKVSTQIPLRVKLVIQKSRGLADTV